MKGWKQYIELAPVKPFGVFDAFERLWLPLGAPRVMALFARSIRNPDAEIWLLTPAAATALIDKLPGTWTDVEDVTQHEWSLLIGEANAHARFGLRATLGRPLPD